MKLNIGGQQGKSTYTFPEGWTCVDLLPGADVVCDIQNSPLPFEDNSIDAIFCSHILEHLWGWNHTFTIKEFLRVLKSGGLIRIIVPDMDIAVNTYLANRDSGKALVALLRWSFDPLLNDNKEVQLNHVGGFNYPLMRMLLKSSGFKEVIKLKYKRWSDIFTGCDNPDHEGTSLYIEAIKL